MVVLLLPHIALVVLPIFLTGVVGKRLYAVSDPRGTDYSAEDSSTSAVAAKASMRDRRAAAAASAASSKHVTAVAKEPVRKDLPPRYRYFGPKL